MLSEAQKLCGTDEPPAPWRTVRAGPLAADLENGQLRYIRHDGVEVLRAISFLVRDRYWGTFASTIDDLVVDETADRFTIRYSGRCAHDDGDLRYDVEIGGEASGHLSFRATGLPVADLVTNRLGFVVLHPLAGVAGAEVELEHTDGRRQTVTLPSAISPHEPAQDLFAITHRAGALSVRVEMTGDAYDMEDQRNWTDASFKTYIRPLSKPRPYTVAGGERFEQSVTVRVTQAVAAVPATAAPSAAPTPATVPRIGLALEPADLAAAPAGRFGWLTHVTGRPSSPDDILPLRAFADSIGARLELQFAIPAVDPVAELAAWTDAEVADSVLVTPWRLYPLRPTGAETGNASLAEIAHAARATFPHILIGGGVLTGFTEFNRNPPPTADVDYVGHATTAIVHAADDRSVIETLETLPHVFASARALSGDLPHRVGPATIGMALNPDGPPRFTPGERMAMVRNDPRQRGLFAAAWTLGYAAAVIPFGVELFTAGFVSGDLGLVDGDRLRPVYHVVRALAQAGGQPVSLVNDLTAGCIGLEFSGSRWLANLTPEPIAISATGSATVLDSASFDTAANDQRYFDTPRRDAVETLGPYAVARIWT